MTGDDVGTQIDPSNFSHFYIISRFFSEDGSVQGSFSQLYSLGL